MPCPGCGYDLRAAVVREGRRRCPECGKEAEGRVRAGTLPWVRRRELGWSQGYVRTLLMVVWRPGRFEGVVRGPVEKRSAMAFERVNLWLGVMVGAVMIKALLNDAGHMSLAFPRKALEWAVMPVMALSDTWWGVLPAMLGTWVWMRGAMAVFRWLVWMGGRNALERGRLARAGRYLSAVVMVVALLVLGGECVAVVDVRIPGYHWSKSWVGGGILLLWGLALVCHVAACIGAVQVAMLGRGWRTLLIAIYPVGALVSWGVVMLAMLWVMGYVAVAVTSMVR